MFDRTLVETGVLAAKIANIFTYIFSRSRDSKGLL